MTLPSRIIIRFPSCRQCLTSFTFSLSHRPGSWNVKPDALSRLYDPEPVAKEPESMLPLTCEVGAVTWQIENKVKRGNGEAPPPDGCPENWLFIPAGLRPQVIHWAQTSLFSCHPLPTSLADDVRISRRFWWSSMEQEVWEYVAACSVCARNKTSTGPPEISMDFVTGLPVSQGNTTVLTVVDRFSKMVRFVALPKLPSARETAEIMINHVFRIHPHRGSIPHLQDHLPCSCPPSPAPVPPGPPHIPRDIFFFFSPSIDDGEDILEDVSEDVAEVSDISESDRARKRKKQFQHCFFSYLRKRHNIKTHTVLTLLL